MADENNPGGEAADNGQPNTNAAANENQQQQSPAGDGGTPNNNQGAPGGEGSKGGEGGAPEFQLPEGMELDAGMLEKATGFMEGLSHEQQQGLVSLYAEQMQAFQQEQHDIFDKTVDDWKAQTIADKDIGGDKFEENIAIAREALDKVGTPELATLLTDYGLGNHPEIVRAFVKVGQMLREDNPGATGAPPTKPQDRASILYPNDRK